jgi:hypothetical protein
MVVLPTPHETAFERKKLIGSDSNSAKDFSIAFATAVTESSDNPTQWIAKNGDDSIFALLQRIFPEVRCLKFSVLI